ncbi:MAG: LCP family protein [Clostridium sp.]|nr:LCP family protein [Clostridium sp.]MCM1444106.1 LCP family protein [Candidatus Amulumruptor caecigallinarius]
MKKKLKLIMENKLAFIIIAIVLLLLTIGTFYLFYVISLLNNIENELRFLFQIIILFIWFIMLHFSFKSLLKNKKVMYISLIVFMIIYIIILIFASFTAHNWYLKISNISTTTNTYSMSIVTLKSNLIEDIKNIDNKDKIGIIDDNNANETSIQEEILKKENLSNETIQYNDYGPLLEDLLTGNIKYAILPANYEITFSSIEELDIDNIKSIYTYSKDVNVETTSNEILDKPFTVLLMGVDSKVSDIRNASLNGDALMLITFNPDTLNATILSIPRDTYTSISCFAGNRKNKITHSAWYGESCVEKTIENLVGIDIDYYVKIDFKGLVELVDSVGGIDVDVPIKFCEQDSDRNFDNLICLDKGVQTLNGEQALALSRHRKTINDFIRGQNQQLVIKGLMDKLIKIRNVDTIGNILDALKNNIETNITTNQIFSLYNVALKVVDSSKTNDTFNMQRLYISGYDKYIFDYSNLYNAGMKLNLYNFIPYEGSLNDVSKAMKVNLGIEEEEQIKKLNFDINNPYKETIIGKGKYQITNSLNLLPNFVGKNVSVANTYAKNNGMNITIKETTGNSSNFVGQIISQSPYANIDTDFMDKSKGITVTVVTSIVDNNIQDNNQNIDNNDNEIKDGDIVIDNEE